MLLLADRSRFLEVGEAVDFVIIRPAAETPQMCDSLATELGRVGISQHAAGVPCITRHAERQRWGAMIGRNGWLHGNTMALRIAPGLEPGPFDFALTLYEILKDRDKPYYEHHLAS
ncbi:MAG: hypothetical protein P4L83_24020 [Nevskia sp.]|nr:hypothetical protein [Nevskia sp.]